MLQLPSRQPGHDLLAGHPLPHRRGDRIPELIEVAQLPLEPRAVRDVPVAGDHDGARAAFDHFTPLSFWRLQFPILTAKEVLRRIGVFKAAYLREPTGPVLDEQDQRELSAILERME